jgi:hypothetical protein
LPAYFAWLICSEASDASHASITDSAVISTALFAFEGDRHHLSHVAAMKADVDCKAHSC